MLVNVLLLALAILVPLGAIISVAAIALMRRAPEKLKNKVGAGWVACFVLATVVAFFIGSSIDRSLVSGSAHQSFTSESCILHAYDRKALEKFITQRLTNLGYKEIQILSDRKAQEEKSDDVSEDASEPVDDNIDNQQSSSVPIDYDTSMVMCARGDSVSESPVGPSGPNVPVDYSPPLAEPSRDSNGLCHFVFARCEDNMTYICFYVSSDQAVFGLTDGYYCEPVSDNTIKVRESKGSALIMVTSDSVAYTDWRTGKDISSWELDDYGITLEQNIKYYAYVPVGECIK